MKLMRKTGLLISTSLFVIVIVAWIRIPRAIKISKIECESQYGNCNQRISEEIEANLGLSLIDVKKETASLLINNFSVNDFSFQFILPDTLRVQIIEPKAVYGIKYENNDDISLRDLDGNITSSTNTTNLPLLVVEGRSSDDSEELKKEEEFAGKLLYNVYYSHQVKNGIAKSDGVYFKINDIEVIFPKDGDISVLIGSLSVILSRLRSDREESNIDGGQVSCVCFLLNECRDSCTIDLRFKNPVIR